MRHLTTIYVTVLTAIMIACGGDDNATADSGKSGGEQQSGKLPTYPPNRQLAFRIKRYMQRKGEYTTNCRTITHNMHVTVDQLEKVESKNRDVLIIDGEHIRIV